MKTPVLPYMLAVGPPVIKAFVSPKRRPEMKLVIAVFLYGGIIWALWDINLELAQALAWAMAISSLLVNGVPVIQAISSGV